MAYVTLDYYKNTYYGDLVPDDQFDKYEAAAEGLINAAMRYKVDESNFDTLKDVFKTAIKNAICAQMEYYGSVGIEASSLGVSGTSFTVGKVSVNRDSNEAAKGAALMTLAPAAKLYLEQTGLLNRDVAVPVEPFTPVWW